MRRRCWAGRGTLTPRSPWRVFFGRLRRSRRTTLFPYTTLFRSLIVDVLGGERPFAVRRECHGRNLFAHRYGVHHLDLFSADGEYGNRVIRPVGNERQIARTIDCHARRLPAPFYGGD